MKTIAIKKKIQLNKKTVIKFSRTNNVFIGGVLRKNIKVIEETGWVITQPTACCTDTQRVEVTCI